MEAYINIAAQILFAGTMVVFVIYSIIAIYALNTYGVSRSVTMSLSAAYLGAMIILMSWAWIALGKI
ncbi:MAG: hypothetical protein KW793_04425 [Candidatus Doudnabacteria bacterium]|nr:hypothetical protein [Candidatus Doudnabacteria bacterium]